MAFFTPSCLISEIRGSVGDQTFSRNAAGPVVKQKLVQPASSTAKQVANRTNLADAVAAWQGLTEFQRRGWMAAAKDYPVYDSLGRRSILPGYNFYISCFLTCRTGNLANPSLWFVKYQPPQLTSFTVYFADGARRMDFEWYAPDDYPLVYLYFSKPQSPGRNVLNPSWMYFQGQYTVDNISNRSLTSIYNSLFGVTYSLLGNQFLWVGIKIVYSDSGISEKMYAWRFKANTNGQIHTA
jgi:hypothetical protein